MPLVDYSDHLSRMSGKPGKQEDGLIYYLADGRGVARAYVVPNDPKMPNQMVRAFFS